MATTNNTWTNAPIVYVPTIPSSQAISRMTAMVYSMVHSPVQMRVQLTPATRAEAIRDPTHLACVTDDEPNRDDAERHAN